jgi:pimeloyl-ACP methyl ester carboxylesterase
VPTANCNGIDLHYEVQGEGEPLICVMGLATDSSGWQLNVGPFAERFQTVVFDNRDVGRSGYATEDYSLAEMARDTLALADHLDIDSFHLLGCSMGGAISQELALMHPERVRTLTLAVSWAKTSKWFRARGRSLWSERLDTPEKIVENMLMLTVSEKLFNDEANHAQAMEHMLNHPYPQRADGFIRQVKATNGHDSTQRIGELTMPVHVIGAECDVLIPVWKSKELHQLIPGSKLTVVEDAAHGMNLELANDFNRAVLDFLAEHTTAKTPTN